MDVPHAGRPRFGVFPPRDRQVMLRPIYIVLGPLTVEIGEVYRAGAGMYCVTSGIAPRILLILVGDDIAALHTAADISRPSTA